MAIKNFPYAVIWNGKFIPANTPVQEEVKANEPKKKAVRKNDKRTNRKS